MKAFYLRSAWACGCLGLFGLTCLVLLSDSAKAKSPATIAEGKSLFERTWTPRNPQLGNDGLGPLFNGNSCVSCHNQGGMGGAGEARFNAKTIGIENLEIKGSMDESVIPRLVKTFHPGFVQDDGSVVNTFTIPHHGGSADFQKWNKTVLANLRSDFSKSGGSASAEEVRRSNATPILFTNKVGNHQMMVKARLFQRNTTPIFGAGLVDQVDEQEMVKQFKAQRQHPEISGRPATLRNGGVGRFGWRGNVRSLLDFVDQACANEVGLETERKPQGKDPMYRDYNNPSIDITDNQIRAMRDFLSALPAPIRKIPQDSAEREKVLRGEQAFASVGCAVCHVPNMGPAKGLYSDLLLHEMGNESLDLNHAEPYILRRGYVQNISHTNVTRTSPSPGSMGAYYGETTSITMNPPSEDLTQAVQSRLSRRNRTGSNRTIRPRVRSKRGETGGDRISSAGDQASNRRNYFSFAAPTAPSRMRDVFSIGSEQIFSKGSVSRDDFGRTTSTQESANLNTSYQIDYERTKFNEEWRTPPLWGCADSAPYMHDGRAETLLEAIAMHDGEASGTRDRFLNLSLTDRHAIIAFLKTMVAPPNVPIAPVVAQLD